ncbi:MAG TPA: PD-(D/E)XK motif protein [Phenylobacterium sp.]|uniref:PD-(D/E)XK motif protein n=1 Tax=Phenylobacterium sp. TaxID=1871053 RepID=UPI002F93F077
MAPRIDAAQIGEAWRALRSEGREGGGESGWRTIVVHEAGNSRVLAAVRHPALEEAILVAFPSLAPGQGEELPRGSGFEVGRVSKLEKGAGACLALSRASAASLELFEAMAADVTALMWRHRTMSEARLLQVFLGRIRSWQAFMSRPPPGVLSPEAELGLIGELACMRALFEAGVPPDEVIGGWDGPLDGLHDFHLGHAAIEVKATLSGAGFPATISSLDQLDTAIVSPLFLAAFRFVQSEAGKTLPQWVEEIRAMAGTARQHLDMRLLRGGFVDADAGKYTRRLAEAGARIMAVDETLPRLARSEVPPAIRAARYELDLDLLSAPPLSIRDALDLVGMPT